MFLNKHRGMANMHSYLYYIQTQQMGQWIFDIIPGQSLSSRPVYGPVGVSKRPEFWLFSPKPAVWGKKSEFDFRCETLLSDRLRVLCNKSAKTFVRPKAYKPLSLTESNAKVSHTTSRCY